MCYRNMCHRDDIIMERYCSFCGQKYYGDLGHRDCPIFKKEKINEVAVSENQENK